MPRIGVSERRLRKPVWMSRARSVPAFMVAKSAPWMNGTASANATNEVVGEVGMGGPQSHGAPLDRSTRVAEAGEDLSQLSGLFRIVRDRLDGRPPDLRLELAGRPLRDDVAVVDDPDTVSQDVGLLEVL